MAETLPLSTSAITTLSNVTITDVLQLGIGTSAPEELLHITQDELATVTTVLIENARTDLVNLEKANVINFRTGGGNIIGQIESFTEGVSQNQGGLKFSGYDAGFNAGITLFKDGDIVFGGTKITAPNGTELLPGITFDTLDTGFFRPASDQIGISTDGVERFRIDSTGKVGIGQPAPVVKMHAAGTSIVNSSIETELFSNDALCTKVIMSKNRGATINADAAVQSGDDIGVLVYSGQTDVAGVDTYRIRCRATSAFVSGVSASSNLVFESDPLATGTPVEQIVFEGNGDAIFKNDVCVGGLIKTAMLTDVVITAGQCVQLGGTDNRVVVCTVSRQILGVAVSTTTGGPGETVFIAIGGSITVDAYAAVTRGDFVAVTGSVGAVYNSGAIPGAFGIAMETIGGAGPLTIRYKKAELY